MTSGPNKLSAAEAARRIWTLFGVQLVGALDADTELRSWSHWAASRLAQA